MTPSDLIDDLRSKINPVYSAQAGTESYERRICAETIEGLLSQRDELLAAMVKASDFIQPYNSARDLLVELDEAIASVKGTVKESLTPETTAPAIVFYPAGSLGEEVAP